MNINRRDFLVLAGAGLGAGALAGGLSGRLHAADACGGKTPCAPGGDAGGLDFARWLQPVPDSAVFSDPDYYIWCGTMARDEHGRCHLYYSRWPKKEGFAAWVTHSEVAHAVAGNPLGPYRHAGVALPARGPEFWDGHCTHNPTVFAHGGKFYLYYMGNRGDRQPGKLRANGGGERALNWTHRNNQRIGVAVADSAGGPWRRFDKPVIDVTPGFHDSLMCSNPSVTDAPGGGVLMIYKGVGEKKPKPFGGPVVHLVATAKNPVGPFAKHPQPIFTSAGVEFPAEDPFIWRDERGGRSRYWAIVKDMNGHFANAGRSLVLMYSENGYDWSPAPHPLVCRTEYRKADGAMRKLYALERPQLWLENGEPRVLFCAGRVAAGDPCETFNVAIPLKRPAR